MTRAVLRIRRDEGAVLKGMGRRFTSAWKAGRASVRGLARALEREVKRVHEDVGLLIEVGPIERTTGGRVRVPHAVIEADFELRAA